jgi:hypothetical protein
MPRDFELREADREYLERLGLAWETIRENGIDWLVIHDWPIPPGYNVVKAKAALQLPGGYPDTQIDMVYFHPHLTRQDGKGLMQITSQDVGGTSFQRWSRHRTGGNPWVAGEDCLETHMVLVNFWLKAELRR